MTILPGALGAPSGRFLFGAAHPIKVAACGVGS